MFSFIWRYNDCEYLFLALVPWTMFRYISRVLAYLSWLASDITGTQEQWPQRHSLFTERKHKDSYQYKQVISIISSSSTSALGCISFSVISVRHTLHPHRSSSNLFRRPNNNSQLKLLSYRSHSREEKKITSPGWRRSQTRSRLCRQMPITFLLSFSRQRLRWWGDPALAVLTPKWKSDWLFGLI